MKSVIAVFIVVQLALVQAMAASPGVHDALHHHCDNHDSPAPVCAVDLWFTHGGGELPQPVVAPLPDEAPPAVDFTATAPGHPLLPPAHLNGGIAAHSPPRAP